MSRGKRRSTVEAILLFAGLALAGVCIAAGAETRPAEKADTRSGKLAAYYGFGPMEILKFNWTVGHPICVDVNGDGLTDIVLTNNAKARIELLLQKKNFSPDEDAPVADADDNEDINEIHAHEANWRFKRVGFDLDVAVTQLVVADVNGDRRADLVYHAKDGLYVALQDAPKKPPAGKGGEKKVAAGPIEPRWLPPRKIEVEGALSGARGLAVGDLNGDGRGDLAILTHDGTYLILQKPDGTLAQPVKYRSGGERLRQLYIADVNGDKRSDLVLLAGQRRFPLRVRFQTTDGKLGPEMRYEMPSPSVLELARLGDRPQEMLFAVSAHSGRVRVSALGRDPVAREYPVQTYPLPGSAGADKRDIVAADVNGDGLLDLVVSDPARAEFLLYLADAKTSLTAPKRFPGLMEMQKLRAADIDGSGRSYIVVLSRKEKIIGITRLEKQRLTFPVSVPIEGDPLEMDLADVNGDKQVDLLYISRDKKKGKYFLRSVLSVGRKTAKPGPAIALDKLEDKPVGMMAADIDHDGRVDVMIVRPYGAMLLVLQTAPGKFEEVVRKDIHAGLVADVDARAMSLAPLGKGARPALLLAQRNFARALAFDAAKGWTVIDQYPPASPTSNLVAAAAFVLPGDTEPTIVTYDAARKKLAMLSKKADGTYRITRQIEVPALSIKRMVAGNFGGGGRTSIVLCGAHKIVSISVGATRRVVRKLCTYEPDDKKMGRFRRLAVGDLNADGVPEIVLAEPSRGHVQILAFDAQAKLVDALKFKVFEQHRQVRQSRFGASGGGGEPRAIALADVTGDKKTDLILLVHDRIIIYPQD